MSDDHAYFHDAEPPHIHVLPLSAYFGVLAALLALTVATVAVIFVDLGPFNLPVALTIAAVKAALVGAIFMHLWWDHLLNTVIVVLALVFMAVFLMFCLIDLNSRDLVNPEEAMYMPRNEIVEQYQEANPNGPQLRAFPQKWWEPVDPVEGHLHLVEPLH